MDATPPSPHGRPATGAYDKYFFPTPRPEPPEKQRQHARDAVELLRHGAAGELLAAEVAPGRRGFVRERRRDVVEVVRVRFVDERREPGEHRAGLRDGRRDFRSAIAGKRRRPCGNPGLGQQRVLMGRVP